MQRRFYRITTRVSSMLGRKDELRFSRKLLDYLLPVKVYQKILNFCGYCHVAKMNSNYYAEIAAKPSPTPALSTQVIFTRQKNYIRVSEKRLRKILRDFVFLGPLSLVKEDPEEAEVVVDGEDTALYGPPQYTDADVARVKAEDRENQQKR